MPLIPVPMIVRLGAQPFATASSYKLATYANGDFAGVNLYTTISPTFKLQDDLRGGRGKPRRAGNEELGL